MTLARSLRALRAFAIATLVPLAACPAGSTSTDDGGGGPLNCPTSAAGYPAGPYDTGVGDTIADFCLRTQTGTTGTPADKGLSLYRKELMDKGVKVLAVAGAAEWCGPCRAEQPELVDLYNTYKAAGNVGMLVVVSEKGMNVVADDASAQTWANLYSIPFEVGTDPVRALSPYFNTSSYPNSMVIKLDTMTITYFHVGRDTAALKAAIDAALK